MTLASSGTMSIGGTTANRSINLELQRSATQTSSMGETDLRSLAGVSSGAISMSNFYGKSLYDWTTTITLGAGTFFGQSFRGYSPNVGGNSFGSVTDSTVDLYSGTPTFAFYSVNDGNTFFYVFDNSSPSNNAGWTTVDLYFGTAGATGTPNATRNRADLNYSLASGTRFWDMADTGQTNGTFTFLSNVAVTLGFK